MNVNIWAPIMISLAATLLSFWTAHASNRRRFEQEAARMATMEAKLNLIYEWFATNIVGSRQHGD